jgi:TetR/AcrR family transcriptional repressor of nem operon
MCHIMARTKEFDQEMALDAAIAVFRQNGFEGTSTDMLVGAMKIGRQSLYDTFGDKWQLYQRAVGKYCETETRAHMVALQAGETALGGIRRMIDRVVENAGTPCLGVNSICEFGRSRPELVVLHDGAERRLNAALGKYVREAQAAGEIAKDVIPEEAATFLSASFAGIRIAARGGADRDRLEALGRLALRALQSSG